MASIITIINNLDHLSQEQKEKYLKSIEVKKIPKGTLLQSKGDSNVKFYYVNKGLLRSYSIDEKGKEHIYMFAPEDWVVGDMVVDNEYPKAELYIDAIEESEVEIVHMNSFEGFENMISSNHGGTEIKRLMKRIQVLQRRVIMLMSYSAKERYEEFVKTYPQIIQRVPQKMIASYLGITPEALSKLKSDIIRGK